MRSAPRHPSRICCAALLASLGAVAAAPALAAGDPQSAASAAGVEVLMPDAEPEVGGWASAPPAAADLLRGYTFPAEGDPLVSAGLVRALAEAAGETAAGEAIVRDVELFGGEITIGRAIARAAADALDGAVPAAPSSWQVTGLTILGEEVAPAPNLRVELADWGYAVVLEHASAAAPAEGEAAGAEDGEPDETATTVALRVVLTAEHAGLPAGTEIVVGLAQAAADARVVDEGPPPAEEPPAEEPPAEEPPAEEPPAEEPEPAGAPKPRDRPAGGDKDRGEYAGEGRDGADTAGGGRDGGDRRDGARDPREGGDAPQGDRPGEVPVRRPGGGVRLPATPGGYVFPVAGEASFGDSFGAARASVGWHHGEDIFAPEGTPIVAVADGTLFRVGWNPVGGWRLWLRDRAGNEFYYAHLSAFAPLARPGATVRAGQVIGFVGRTGDARTTPPHLHFEIHPRQLLHLGYDGVVNAYPYLSAWRRLTDLDLATARADRAERRDAELARERAARAIDAPHQAAQRRPAAAPAQVTVAGAPARGRAVTLATLPVTIAQRQVHSGSGDGRLWVDRRERLGSGHDGWRAASPA